MKGRLALDAFLSMRAADLRLARLTHDVPLPVATGLEIGAGGNPLALPETCVAEYVDYERTAATQLPGGVDVDHVWAGSGSLSAQISPAAGYDFVIGSQVAQYVPNFLGWLRGLAEVLRPGGVLNLSLPDRRFTFDIRRQVSTLGELLEAYYHDYARPSLRQVFDHTYTAVAMEPSRLWSEEVRVADLPRFCGEHALELAHENVRCAHRDGAYILCHCWVFTPLSFLELIADVTRLGLFPLVINQFSPTEPGSFEFFVSFRRDAEERPAELKQMQLAAIDYLTRLVQRQLRQAGLFAGS